MMQQLQPSTASPLIAVSFVVVFVYDADTFFSIFIKSNRLCVLFCGIKMHVIAIPLHYERLMAREV